MKHIKIEIVVAEDRQEELIALFDDYGAAGFEQTDKKLIAYFTEDAFPHDDILKTLDGYEATVSIVEETNWNVEWERNFQPVIVADFCAVRAHFHAPVINVEHEIIITPKMSFGTGHHATTYMMMEQMKNIDFAGKAVFDFGTGTGVLAILASKLGAASIIAIDVDDWSIENAKENVERNECSNIDIQLSTKIPAKQFDCILANINRNVLLNYMGYLKQALNRDSHLLLSGLMLQDEEAIINCCHQHQLTLQKRGERQGWMSLLFVTNM